MKYYFLLLLLFLGLPAVYAQDPSQDDAADASDAPYIERQEKVIRFFPGGKVAVAMTVPGNLRIIGWKRGEVRMEAEKIVYYLPREKARTFLEKPPIRIRHNDTSATFEAAGAPESPGILEINIVLYVPGDKTDLTIEMKQGELALDSVNGWIEATLGEGSLDIKSLSGYFSGKTIKGDISAEMSDSRWRGLEFSALTQEGSIDLRLPESFSAALQLETRNGTIEVDYPPQEVDGELTPPDIIIKEGTQLLRASVGDGGSPVRLSTLSGNVRLSRSRKD